MTFDATTAYWQRIEPATATASLPTPPYRTGYPAPLPNGEHLVLPLRAVPNQPDVCVASFIANQASFGVIETLAGIMADRARPYQVDLVVGLPTLGLSFAPRVAQLLGFDRFIPFGYSKKYWYQAEYAVPVQSLTTPDSGKMLYVDPNLLPLLAGARVLLIDDAVSTGQTMVSALALLERCGAQVAAIAVAMRQGDRWKTHTRTTSGRAIPVEAAFDSPRMKRVEGGWVPQ